MVKTYPRHGKRRFQRLKMPIKENKTNIQTCGIRDKKKTWNITNQINLEKELEAAKAAQTLTICEDCLREIGIEAEHSWKGNTECDICGQQEWCNIFEPDDTLKLGDVYANEPLDWPEETLVCDKCGNQGNPRINTANEFCESQGCLGRYRFITEQDAGKTETEELEDDKIGMLICNFCGTNWEAHWGAYCNKCTQGLKMVQTIPKEARIQRGNTEKVCDTCGELWAESANSTTCSYCEYGSVSYRAITVPNIAPQHFDRELPELRRIWIPDYDGPIRADGGTGMKEVKNKTSDTVSQD